MAPVAPPPYPAPDPELTLAQLLALLPTAAEVRTGYDRDLFKHWIDADGDGCDTRREVLIVEAVTAPTVGAGCFLSGGSWLSQYDGVTFTDPSGMDIDHMVALAEAWDSGARLWGAARRQAFEAGTLRPPGPGTLASSRRRRGSTRAASIFLRGRRSIRRP